MKSYNLILQEKEGYCLCSTLQAIFGRYGINISQKQIADNLTPSEKGFLAHDDKIKDLLKLKRFEYWFYWHNETPFNEPDSLLLEMHDNNGIIGINSHIYLLRYFKDPLLEMIDPADNKHIKKSIYDILKEMQKSVGFFGLIKRLE